MLLPACSHAGALRPTHTANPRALPEIKIGVRAYQHHSYKTALGHFDRALKFDANNTEARYDRALTEEKFRAFGIAESDLRAVLRVRPTWTAARLHLAAAQYQKRQYVASTRNFDIALKADGKAAQVWLDDGVSYYAMHRYADARKRFARALDLSPKSGRAHFWLGMTYGHLHNHGKARAELALAAYSRDRVVRTAARRQLTGR